MTLKCLSYKEYGEIHGLTARSARTYFEAGRLADPDVVIGGGVLRGQVEGLELREDDDGRNSRSDARYGWLPETAVSWERVGRGARTDLAPVARERKQPTAYLSYKEFGEIHGLTERSARTYFEDGRLPDPDVVVGGGKLRGEVEGLELREGDDGRSSRSDARSGWLPQTALAWRRVGQGTRTDLQR
ncbi:hypothetical protein [Nocardia salmonicida]|uniref:hypothetical protein n=1 Tax=Nocardia salmonicida TaxID=53431 RepID=UPI0007A4661C|nr:hypothetical protein [Nocardia salmonicida]MBC7299821.1 hypothetical protein [Nocardia sp.]